MGIIDLLKAIVSQNSDDINKGYKLIVKRLVYGVIIFFVPMIIKYMVTMVTDTSDMQECFWAIANPKDAMEKSNIVRGSFSKSSDFTTKEACERAGRKWILTHSERVNCGNDGCYICVEKGN